MPQKNCAEVKAHRDIQWTSLGCSTLQVDLQLATTWLPSNFQKDSRQLPDKKAQAACLPRIPIPHARKSLALKDHFWEF